MKSMILAAGLALGVPLAAQAQVVFQSPPIVRVQRAEPDDYWRHHEGEHDAEWRRREEYHAEAERQEDWRRRHCVRDWQNHEFCRR